MDRGWVEVARKVAGHKRAFRNCHKVFSSVLNLLYASEWYGACHASSAITHIALKEMGTDSALVLGEAVLGIAYFDHSWVEVDSLPVDSAISLPLLPEFSARPVFLGADVGTGLPTSVVYRASVSDLDDDARRVADNDLGWYFDNFDANPAGFFVPLLMVLKGVGINRTEEEIRRRYGACRWTMKGGAVTE